MLFQTDSFARMMIDPRILAGFSTCTRSVKVHLLVLGLTSLTARFNVWGAHYKNNDKTNTIPPQSGYHTVRSSEADIHNTKLLKQVHNDSNIFSSVPGQIKFEGKAL